MDYRVNIANLKGVQSVGVRLEWRPYGRFELKWSQLWHVELEWSGKGCVTVEWSGQRIV